MLSLLSLCAQAEKWTSTGSINLNGNVVQIIKDADRPLVYAIDKINSDILFINLEEMRVTKRLYVGKDPTSFDINIKGNTMYVANKGFGTGTPAGYQIAVVDLDTQTKTNYFITSYQPVNLVTGRKGIIYYNDGNYGAEAINAETGAQLSSIAGNRIKTMMVVKSDKSKLYGQYVYTGNLGEMGVFNISTDTITKTDRHPYSPYASNYGWAYKNYSISGDDSYLAYGRILFNPDNLMNQYGLFSELIYALNYDGSIAFGSSAIWDTTTFPIHGDATKISDLPFTTSIIHFDTSENVLYAFNSVDQTLQTIERCTSSGISHRWLESHGCSTNDSVSEQDTENDGLTVLQEWILDSNPNELTSKSFIRFAGPTELEVMNSSSARFYELIGCSNLMSNDWSFCDVYQGTGTNTVIDISQYPLNFFRVSATLFE